MEITAGSLAAAYRNEVICFVVIYMILGGTVLLVTFEE
jgi:hypothetical protein